MGLYKVYVLLAFLDGVKEVTYKYFTKLVYSLIISKHIDELSYKFLVILVHLKYFYHQHLDYYSNY